MSTILLGVTGSIAAYKACELTRLFVKSGHAVHVLMTDAATRFVSPLTFRTLSRNPVSAPIPPRYFIPFTSPPPNPDPLVVPPPLPTCSPPGAPLPADILTPTPPPSPPSHHPPPHLPPHLRPPPTRAPTSGSAPAPRRLSPPTAPTPPPPPPPPPAPPTAPFPPPPPPPPVPPRDLACGTSGKGRMAEPQAVYDAVLRRLAECGTVNS
jgi:hypothetical protein